MTDRADVDLSKLGKDELDVLVKEIDKELENHHEADSDEEKAVLNATKAATEAHFEPQGIFNLLLRVPSVSICGLQLPNI